MTIEHQDSEIIILNNYIWTGDPDGIWFRIHDIRWCMSVIGDPYKVLMRRSNKTVIQIVNEYYDAKYSAIETSLTGDVLILGMGLATLDQFLVTGSSWKWVEKNNYLATNITPANGTVHEGDAEDETFIGTLGTFDTILIDFPQTKLNDYDQFLNVGGSVIEFKL